MMPIDHVLVLGAGYTGLRVARQAQAAGLAVTCTTRTHELATSLRAAGFEVLVGDLQPDALVIRPSTMAIVCFPPDGETDSRIAPALSAAASIRYVSTTGVYSNVPRIDDETPVTDAPSPSHARVLAAEGCYRALGGTVLRAPGIYGPDRGLHVRVVQGKHQLPDGGHNVLSRIHADDLATLLLARPEICGETFVLADHSTETQHEVVRWICDEYGVPFPPSVPGDAVHASLRVSRRIDSSRALRALGVTLRWPTFREGMARAATNLMP